MGLTAGRRPCQGGQLAGGRNDARAEVEWLVDTGADITTVRKSVGAKFEAEPVGLSASPTTGGGGIQVVAGLVAGFEVEDESGVGRRVWAEGYVGIKAGDAGSNLLGMEQVAAVGATLSWDPSFGRGSLRSSAGVQSVA